MRSALPALLVLLGLPALAAPPQPPPPPPPSDAECKPLPALLKQQAFVPGETLEFDLDALGAKAGTMTMRVLPQKDGLLPFEVKAQTNTFFSKVRRVNGTVTSWVNPRTLRPSRYLEQTQENEVRRVADVTFRQKERRAALAWQWNTRKGRTDLRFHNEALDVAGAIYLMRQLPLKEGQSLCVDLYGVRRIWRLYGRVEKREHVSLPLGEFDAWHFAGKAVRRDAPSEQREVHVWISDDARRLPLAALGTIDLGAVRATLTSYNRPGDGRARAQGQESLKW